MGAGARNETLPSSSFLEHPRDERDAGQGFVSQRGIHAVLVGKDGEPKLPSFEPISASELTRSIDAMPIAQAGDAPSGP